MSGTDARKVGAGKCDGFIEVKTGYDTRSTTRVGWRLLRSYVSTVRINIISLIVTDRSSSSSSSSSERVGRIEVEKLRN